VPRVVHNYFNKKGNLLPATLKEQPLVVNLRKLCLKILLVLNSGPYRLFVNVNQYTLQDPPLLIAFHRDSLGVYYSPR